MFDSFTDPENDVFVSASVRRGLCLSRRIRLFKLSKARCLGIVVLLISVTGTPQLTSELPKENAAVQTLPESQPELTQLKLQTDRKIADEEARLSAWKMIVANLTSAKELVARSNPPDPTASTGLQRL
jgi:hypothetical protein